MIHIQIEAKNELMLGYMNKIKRKLLKVAILIIAVMYLYYCVLYSIYMHL